MQLITALGNEAACGEAQLPEGCCMLVTVIAAKRCHCLMPMPKQARCLPWSLFNPFCHECQLQHNLLQMLVSKSPLLACGQYEARVHVTPDPSVWSGTDGGVIPACNGRRLCGWARHTSSACGGWRRASHSQAGRWA